MQWEFLQEKLTKTTTTPKSIKHKSIKNIRQRSMTNQCQIRDKESIKNTIKKV